jgi:hypothetical protein
MQSSRCSEWSTTRCVARAGGMDGRAPGRIDAMAQYAGMGVGSVTRVLAVADLVAKLVSHLA